MNIIYAAGLELERVWCVVLSSINSRCPLNIFKSNLYTFVKNGAFLNQLGGRTIFCLCTETPYKL